MGPGNIAGAIMFVCTLAGMAVVGLYVLGYAAHCILVVVQGTAAERDDFTWPNELLIDWLWPSISLLGLVLIWLIPAGFLSRGLSEVWLVDQGPLRTVLLAVPGLWLLFPVGLLSSLSAISRWVFFRPIIAWQMLRLFPSTMAVYLVSAVLAVLAAVAWFETIFGGYAYLLVLTAPFSAALLLIYARLIGRLAYCIQRLPQGKSTARKKPSAKKPRVKAQVIDSWDEPEKEPEPAEKTKPRPEADEVGDEWDQDFVRSGYGLSDSGKNPASATPPRRDLPLDPEEEDGRRGYGLPTEEGVQAADRMSNAPPPPQPGPSTRQPRPRNLLRKQRTEKELAWPMVSGVYGFPWRGKTLDAWVRLSFGLVVLGVGLLALRAFAP